MHLSLGNVHDRFRCESRLSQRMEHDALIAYRDSGEHIGTPFLAMELALGSLRDELEQSG